MPIGFGFYKIVTVIVTIYFLFSSTDCIKMNKSSELIFIFLRVIDYI